MKKDSLMTKQQLIAEEQKRLFKNRKVVQLNKFIKGDVSPFTVNDLKIFKLIISKVDSKDSLFQDFYDNYSLSEDYTFHDELREAHRIKDLNQIKKWLHYWKEKSEKNSDGNMFIITHSAGSISHSSLRNRIW